MLQLFIFVVKKKMAIFLTFFFSTGEQFLKCKISEKGAVQEMEFLI